MQARSHRLDAVGDLRRMVPPARHARCQPDHEADGSGCPWVHPPEQRWRKRAPRRPRERPADDQQHDDADDPHRQIGAGEELVAVRVEDDDRDQERQEHDHLAPRAVQPAAGELALEPNRAPDVAARLEHPVAHGGVGLLRHADQPPRDTSTCQGLP